MSQPPGSQDPDEPRDPDVSQQRSSGNDTGNGRSGAAGDDLPAGEQPVPRPRGGRLAWVLGGATALVVLAGVAVLLVVLLGDGPGDPETTAQQAVTAMNEQDTDGMIAVLCEEARDKAREFVGEVDDGQEPEFQVTVSLDAVTENEDTATADVTASFDEIPAEWEGIMPEEQALRLEMIVEDDEWKVCDLTVGS
ncbi:hypothetical protein H0B56_05050 [Haloechinothrix sp. YIM 98757]|uniref:Uncharacterized protein n=1 Tax=Haloechinothrix aidingensis TaxID=2752311 RepID=A0A837ZXL1_9PSEU|nr:hypothetical protein [Haloechinothrix aidingensis]MBA0124904.1 hypothetical protein [Haloechinothrix aidingensis]